MGSRLNTRPQTGRQVQTETQVGRGWVRNGTQTLCPRTEKRVRGKVGDRHGCPSLYFRFGRSPLSFHDSTHVRTPPTRGRWARGARPILRLRPLRFWFRSDPVPKPNGDTQGPTLQSRHDSSPVCSRVLCRPWCRTRPRPSDPDVGTPNDHYCLRRKEGGRRHTAPVRSRERDSSNGKVL